MPMTLGEIDLAFEARDRGEKPHRPSSRRDGLGWLVLGLAALCMFEWTADPALAVVLGCIKFGWDDLATARWLRRADPDRLRGRITARFYAAWSLWRISAVGVLMMIVVVFAFAPLEAMMRARGKPLPDVPREFMTVVLVAFFGMIASSLVSFLAIGSAWRNGVRVWVGPEAKRAKALGHWPPVAITAATPRANRADWITLALLIWGAVLTTLCPFIISTIRRPTMPSLILGGVILVFFRVASIGTRVAARTPEECWPRPELASAEGTPRGDIASGILDA